MYLSFLHFVARRGWPIWCAVLLAGCASLGADDTAPKQQRVLVFWDVTRSISIEERRVWRATLEQMARGFGGDLWLVEEYDEIVVLPLHRNSATAGPLVRQRFSGGEFNGNARRNQRGSFRSQLAKLDSLRFVPACWNGPTC